MVLLHVFNYQYLSPLLHFASVIFLNNQMPCTFSLIKEVWVYMQKSESSELGIDVTIPGTLCQVNDFLPYFTERGLSEEESSKSSSRSGEHSLRKKGRGCLGELEVIRIL